MVASQRLHLAYLYVDDDDLRLTYADLVVVERDGGAIDWECVAYGLDREQRFEPGPYRLEGVGLDGRTVIGDAILVRSVEGSHVFRGAGELTGLADAGGPDA